MSELECVKYCKKNHPCLFVCTLLCLLSSNVQANKFPGRNVCGNSKCCRIFMERVFRGSGWIANPDPTALLTGAGHRHQISTRVLELSQVPEAIAPQNNSRPSFSLSISRNHLANPFRKCKPQENNMFEPTHQSSTGSSFKQSCGYRKAPAAEEQILAQKATSVRGRTRFLSQNAAATRGTLVASSGTRSPSAEGRMGATSMGQAPRREVAPGAQRALAPPQGQRSGSGDGDQWATVRAASSMATCWELRHLLQTSKLVCARWFSSQPHESLPPPCSSHPRLARTQAPSSTFLAALPTHPKTSSWVGGSAPATVPGHLNLPVRDPRVPFTCLRMGKLSWLSWPWACARFSRR